MHRHRVSSSYVRILYDFLSRRGLDGEAVLGRKEPVADPTGHAYTEVADLLEMFQRAQAVLQEPALGLKVGALIQPAHIGLVGYLLQNCATLGHVLYRYNEFERLYWDSVTGQLRPELRGMRLTWTPLDDSSNGLLDECNLAAILTFARNIAERPDRNPIDVHFTAPPPPDRRPYEQFFGCPVHFGSPVVSISVAYQDLLLPVRRPDENLYHLLEAQARARIAQMPSRDEFTAELSGTIAALLTNGEATLATVSQRLGMSPRTVQRRLDDLGTSFQAVLDTTRQNLSEAYLRDPGLRLAELSILLGYADQAAFTRAFKRWKGVSPARWRSQALAAT